METFLGLPNHSVALCGPGMSWSVGQVSSSPGVDAAICSGYKWSFKNADPGPHLLATSDSAHSKTLFPVLTKQFINLGTFLVSLCSCFYLQVSPCFPCPSQLLISPGGRCPRKRERRVRIFKSLSNTEQIQISWRILVRNNV